MRTRFSGALNAGPDPAVLADLDLDVIPRAGDVVHAAGRQWVTWQVARDLTVTPPEAAAAVRSVREYQRELRRRTL